MMVQRVRECKAVVGAIRWPHPEVIEVDLRVTEPAEWTFQAGQWVSVPFGPKRLPGCQPSRSPYPW